MLTSSIWMPLSGRLTERAVARAAKATPRVPALVARMARTLRTALELPHTTSP